MDPYVKSNQVFVCPSDLKVGAPVISYAYNWCVGSKCGTGGGNTKALADIQLPSQVPAFIESNGSNTSAVALGFVFVSATEIRGRWWTADALGYTDSFGGGLPKVVNHFNGCNFLFADGHVKWQKQTGVMASNMTNDCPEWLLALGFTKSISNNVPAPPREGIDYDANGIVGTTTAFE